MQAKAQLEKQIKAETQTPLADPDPQETAEWLEAWDQILDEEDPHRAAFLLETLTKRARMAGVNLAPKFNTPYVNTIRPEDQVPYPGDITMERRIKSIIRWNALAMVLQQNKKDPGIGGHISTYQSIATLMEVGFNNFFRASIKDQSGDQPGDFVYFQGHASPGIYSRAFLEGRLTQAQVENFRHELRGEPGLSSYPHPWLMPDFWRFPTVSMGLASLNAIYQARFMRYMENRGLVAKTDRKVWAFLGDGEMDEPESMGSITLASREKLDNLIFVINCNLQRLDGPVRGNGSIVRELEAAFGGAGWNVIKVLWGSTWDELLARDTSGLLMKRMEECVDGEYQNFKAKGGAYVREHFFGKYPELRKLVEHLSDEELGNLKRGGHDSLKVYNAYKRAFEHKGQPTVILAKTVKGYGMGASGESRNLAHQAKKVEENDLVTFTKRFNLPIPEEDAKKAKFFLPAADSPEIKYLHDKRKSLGGYYPTRNESAAKLQVPTLEFFKEQLEGSQGREVSSTMAFVRILTLLMTKDKNVGKNIVPIVPDEARTFGMDSLFRQVGIYASQGQLYEPHDADMFLFYKESKDGQILEEGITEAGSMCSFTAAGTAYSNFNVEMVPFYIFYSMFGFQRIGDFAWAFADSRGKGFLMGATAGRTTLMGEGLQHQDGHSLVLASTVPTCAAYDPAYAYELAVIIQDGMRRMYQEQENRFYYITVYNENYTQPAMPEGAEEGIIKGIYKLKAGNGKAKAHLWGSGPMLNEALKAQQILAEQHKVNTDVWSVTSYNELRRDALRVERWNRLHPAEAEQKPYIVKALDKTDGPIIASTDYMKIVPDQLAPWLNGRLVSLGTDGFGRSDNREYLRKHFEINAASIVAATLSKLARDGKFNAKKAAQAIADLGLNPETIDPAMA
ncbi:MAG TPA: pyruvate dehydrogenase (acetyl-transferring), homodimeric type [Blastocatellia bacterium]|nr:pyruvate dehydrogenase (acetyl-transferring), homodimeric type [Blastocatellia bacterium]HNG34694.1 pyruvate dehydrogenase (acetyl-transferring), homodimeric type [Blastocatellia bacterium]